MTIESMFTFIHIIAGIRGGCGRSVRVDRAAAAMAIRTEAVAISRTRRRRDGDLDELRLAPGVSCSCAGVGTWPPRRWRNGIFCLMDSIAFTAEIQIGLVAILVEGLRDNRGPSGRRLVAIEPFAKK